MKHTMSIAKTEKLLQQHGIKDIYDTTTSSCLADDIGDYTNSSLPEPYFMSEVLEWLGY